MGNKLVSPCFPAAAPAVAAAVKLVFWGGTARLLPSQLLAGELMFQFPHSLVCHANSFYIGQPVPALAIDDDLIPGETYFVLPADRLPCGTLTAASLALLSSTKGQQPAFVHVKCPFEFVKGRDGRAQIRVLPEFIEAMISADEAKEGGDGDGDGVCYEICSTPELRKQYDQLVGSKVRPWSPSLETIVESKFRARSSPGRFLACDKFR